MQVTLTLFFITSIYNQIQIVPELFVQYIIMLLRSLGKNTVYFHFLVYHFCLFYTNLSLVLIQFFSTKNNENTIIIVIEIKFSMLLHPEVDVKVEFFQFGVVYYEDVSFIG